MTTINKVWLILTILFFILSFIHFYLAKTEIEKYIQPKGEVKTFNGLSVGNSELVKDFNNYLDRMNKSNRKKT